MNWMRTKLAPMRLRQRVHGQRLREAGHAFDQDVAVAEQRDQQAVDQIALADDDARNLVADGADEA